MLLTPVVWDMYFVHLLIPLLALSRVARWSPRYRLILLGSLLLALGRYWRFILLYSQSPLVMLCGFLAVLLLWLALLRLRTHPEEIAQR